MPNPATGSNARSQVLASRRAPQTLSAHKNSADAVPAAAPIDADDIAQKANSFNIFTLNFIIFCRSAAL
jgi:hypothetical protein